jgi:hypothetical protein
MTMSSRIVLAAFVALATAAAAPALARDQWTPAYSGEACQPDVRDALHGRGGYVKGFDHHTSGFGQLPTDIVIECLGDYQTQGPF